MKAILQRIMDMDINDFMSFSPSRVEECIAQNLVRLAMESDPDAMKMLINTLNAKTNEQARIAILNAPKPEAQEASDG